MTNKIFALIGPHASGKSILLKKLLAMGIHYIPQITTRSPGKLEGDREFFHFVSKDEFLQQDLIIKTSYRGDYYGLLKKEVLSSLQKYPISVLLIDPAGHRQLSRLIKDSFESIYLMSDYVALVERMLQRGHTNAEIKQHLEYSENNNEFDSWKIATHVVKNTASENQMLLQVLAIMGLAEKLPPNKLVQRLKPMDEKI